MLSRNARLALGLLVLPLGLTQPALADDWDVLRNDPVLSEGLVQFTMARRIYKRCDEIGARRLRAIGYLTDLADHAESLGVARSEIRAYVDDDAEQDRVAAIADARLAEQGASPENMAGYCTVGQAEIAAGSTIGRLLR